MRNAYPLAVHLIFLRGDDVLFLQRGPGYAAGQWSVPAGHVEAGESASAAAVRECVEELGLQISDEDLSLSLVQHKRDPLDSEERVDLFFRVTRFEGEPQNREPDKTLQLRWEHPTAMRDVVGYVHHALQSISRGDVYAEFGW